MKKFMNKLEKVTGIDLDGDGTVGGSGNRYAGGGAYQGGGGYQAGGGYQGAGYQGYTNQMPTAAPAQGNLPPGWEAKYDPNSGRTFYVNHQTQKTQWEPPTAAPATGGGGGGGAGMTPKFCSGCGTKVKAGGKFCENCGTKIEAPAQSGGGGGYSGGQAIPQASAAQNYQASGRKKALLVGLNYRGTSAELRGCINDVRAMRELLLSEGFPERDMMVLTDDQRGPYCPTRNNVLRACQQLVAGAQPGDVFFFHFSGHGSQEVDHSGREDDGYNETIVPADYNSGGGMILDDELFRLLVAGLPAGCKLTALMDCCHAGTGLDLAYNWESQGWVIDGRPSHASADVQLFSGCQDHQTSSDGDNLAAGGGRYQVTGGAMTASFIRAYQARKHQTYPELINRIRGELQKRGFSQFPNLSSSQPFEVQQKVFSIAQGEIIPNMNPPPHGKYPVQRKQMRPITMGPFAGGGMGIMEGVAAVGMGMMLMNMFD